jgi:hypothetical protein
MIQCGVICLNKKTLCHPTPSFDIQKKFLHQTGIELQGVI